MALKINVFGQILVGQLENLYYYLDSHLETIPEDRPADWQNWTLKIQAGCPDTHLLYEHLEKEGEVNLELDNDTKKQLWKLAVRRFNSRKTSKTWIKNYENMNEGDEKKARKEWLDKELAKLYKSYLLRHVLGNKLYKENLRLNLHVEGESVLKQLTITGR